MSMKMKELREKSDTKLKDMLSESRAQLHALQFQISSGQVKRVREIRRLRRHISRILTLQREKRYAQQ